MQKTPRWSVIGMVVVGLAAGIFILVELKKPGTGPTPAQPPVEQHVAPLAGSGETTNREMLAGTGGLETAADMIEYAPDASGYFARPVEAGEYPGVVMIHEWWGLNENIRDMARQLAAKGYRVLAVDLFGEVAATPDDARRLTSALDQPQATEQMKAAARFLRDGGSKRVASLGWCFGGGQSLQLALADDLDATVIYYGRLVTDETLLRAIEQPVLGVFGDQDASIPVADVRAFEAALKSIGTANEIHVYPGVGHAFANPSGANYAPEETRDAWLKTLNFLDAHLK